MILWRKFVGMGAVVGLGLALAGCDPVGSSSLDERRNPHFVEGDHLAKNSNFKGAVAAYGRALRANPQSASAHLELGLLYEQHEFDFAAAIYHFQRHLELQPHSERTEIVNQHILSCKQELAKSVLPASLPQTAERELMALARKNEDLRRELDWLRVQYAQATNALNSQNARALSPNSRVASLAGTTPGNQASNSGRGASAAPGGMLATASRDAGTTHIVARGDTLSSIARQRKVSLSSLRSANPEVDDRKLRVGQALHLPGS